ncbi:hypothetical protein ALC57_09551 [Trachymyrmex cornetzi]|uniref:THAP-type domain-containing protein n=1 Tax=Trachymyrmex cornetzi TaxID=471704 RepID=A0A151J595_9HYME|nr:hypothetical protein ALC57_09551 [Trachymyrmex cornetzi]
MPTCCVQNCTNHAFYTDRKDIVFYRFPKEEKIRRQWINASGRKEGTIKFDSVYNKYDVILCSLHFDDNCFITQWTQPTKNPARQMKRLKDNSIPTKMLLLGKKRKTMSDSKKKRTNIP